MIPPRDPDLAFMDAALQEAARASAVGEIPVAAILVHGGDIIAQAHNLRELRQDPTAHAELLVIRQAAERLGSWRLTDSTLYVTLEPCAMCAGAIVLSRIDRLVFAAWDPKAGACGSLFDIPGDGRLNHRVAVTGGVREAESRRLLQDFFRDLRRAPHG